MKVNLYPEMIRFLANHSLGAEAPIQSPVSVYVRRSPSLTCAGTSADAVDTYRMKHANFTDLSLSSHVQPAVAYTRAVLIVPVFSGYSSPAVQ